MTLELKIEAIDNVDSVRVDRFGDGTLSTKSGAFQLVPDISFVSDGLGYEFTASPSINLDNILFLNDRIQFSAQPDDTRFYIVSSIVNDTFTISEPLSNVQGSYEITRYFGFRFVIHFDGTGMHTGSSENDGFRLSDISNFELLSDGSCVSLKTYHGGVLRESDDIPGVHASVYIANRNDGPHTSSADRKP